MSFVDVLGAFKNHFSWTQPIVVDDDWDQLNRSFMFILMVVFGTIVTVRGYAGNIIACNGFDKMKKDFVNDYCWTQGLYTIREAYDLPIDRVPYPGLVPEDVPACMEQQLHSGGYVQCPDANDIMAPRRAYHLWYQWVSFYFFLVAAAFYIPYVFYRIVGFAEVEKLCQMAHNPMGEEEDVAKVVKRASTWLYYRFSVYMGPEGSLAKMFLRHKLGLVSLAVKLTYLGVSLGVFYLTAAMFEVGDYTEYGEKWVLGSPFGYRNNTLIRNKLFPKIISCEIKRWGASGIEEEQGMCVLAPNVINQYLFLIQWFCLVFVIATNCFSVLLCLLRFILIFATYRKLLATAFLKNTKLMRHMYYGLGTTGRLTIHIMAHNLGPRVMEDILHDLSLKLKRNGLLEGFDPLDDSNEMETPT